MARGRAVAAFLHYSAKLPGVNLFTAGHARVYRRSRGRAMKRWFGAPVLVLDVRKRVSGSPQTVPLIHLPVDDGWVVVGANAGADRTPQWFRNLEAAGEAVVTVGDRRVAVSARVVEGAEREALWQRFVDAYPSVGHYHRYTARHLPVAVLRPHPR